MIERKIYFIRNKKVLLSHDLAQLYSVETKALNRAVKRNLDRFPEDFMFQLTQEELENLRCQFGTSSYGGHRYPPFAFTEQGVAMLSSVLASKQAIHVNIQIMRAFTHLRQMVLNHKELRSKIEEMEKKYDRQFQMVFEAIKKLLEPPPSPPKRSIGFHAYHRSRSADQETIDILADKSLMKSIRRGERDIKLGKIRAWESVKKSLRKS